MVAHPAEIAAELKTLRKGRGVDVPQISERAGPALREVCGISLDDTVGEIRRKLVTGLEKFAAQLPEDLRLAVLAALAINQEARLPFYQDRIRWVASQLQRDERTARRRVDTGIMRLAEFAAATTNTESGRPEFDLPQPGWRITELQSLVLPHAERPEAIDIRRIVVEAEFLDVLDLAITVPGENPNQRSADAMQIEVLQGGTSMTAKLESSDRFAFQLQLPRRLRRNETHQYTLRYRVPVGESMRPHFVWVSKLACEHFDLRVRFDLDRLPKQIRKVEAAFQRDVDDPLYRGESLEPDAAGDVHVEFWRLTQGLAYGIRWQD